MSDLSGDDLLEVFKDLDILLLNLNPNVVKAWFDTDDPNMKHFLNWMCVSLSKKNYISPLESAEYNAIDEPLSNQELDIEMDLIDDKYPGIFDTEYNLLEIEFLEEDLNLAKRQEKELNEAIEINRNLEEKLNKHLNDIVKEEIESSVKLKTIQEKCLLESQKVDEVNEKIYNKIFNCAKLLQDFEFSPSPTFINNFTIDVYQEKIENLLSILKPILDKSPSVANLTALTNVTQLDSISMDESMANDLSNMHHRILHSQHQYLATKIEVEKLKAILSYLEKTNVESVMSFDDSSLNQNIAIKVETKKRLCNMLEDCTKKFTERHITQAQLKYIEQELEENEENLTELKELEDMIQKMLSHYSVLKILFEQEKTDMENYEKFFKMLLNYINRDLECSIFRTDKMTEIFQKYNDGACQEKLHLTKTIIKLLSKDKENFTVARAHELYCNLNREINFLESKLFTPSFADVKLSGKDLRHSIKVFGEFLVNGPTNRILLVPSELQILIRQVEDVLRKELDSVKSAVHTITSVKKTPTKWQNYRRQLWMYFLADPGRLKFILQEVQEEFERTKITKQD